MDDALAGAAVAHFEAAMRRTGLVEVHRQQELVVAVLDVPVQRPADVETTVRGAGVLAAIGAGLFVDLAEAAALWQLGQDYAPAMSREQRQRLLKGYEQAVAQTLAAGQS